MTPRYGRWWTPPQLPSPPNMASPSKSPAPTTKLPFRYLTTPLRCQNRLRPTLPGRCSIRPSPNRSLSVMGRWCSRIRGPTSGRRRSPGRAAWKWVRPALWLWLGACIGLRQPWHHLLWRRTSRQRLDVQVIVQWSLRCAMYGATRMRSWGRACPGSFLPFLCLRSTRMLPWR